MNGQLNSGYLEKLAQDHLLSLILQHEILISDMFGLLKNLINITNDYHKICQKFQGEIVEIFKTIDETMDPQEVIEKLGHADDEEFKLASIFSIDELKKSQGNVISKLKDYIVSMVKEITIEKLKKKLGLTVIRQEKSIISENGNLNEDVEKLLVNLALMEVPFYIVYKKSNEPIIIQILQINNIQKGDLVLFNYTSGLKINSKSLRIQNLSVSHLLEDSFKILSQFIDLTKKLNQEIDIPSSISEYLLILELFYVDNEINELTNIDEIKIDNEVLFKYLNFQESNRIRHMPEPMEIIPEKTIAAITEETISIKKEDEEEKEKMNIEILEENKDNPDADVERKDDTKNKKKKKRTKKN